MMIAYVALGVFLLIGVLLISRWYVSAEPKTLVRVLKWLAFAVIVGLIAFFAVSGRLGWAVAATPALLIWLRRFMFVASIARGFSKMRGGAGRGGAGPGGRAGNSANGGGGQGNSGPNFSDDAMTADEAYRILELSPGASASDVREAHRRLIAGMHPDHGGSTYLAAKINQAKDVLLRNT